MRDLEKLPALLAARDWAGAERLLRRAAKAKSPPPEVYYNLAKVLEAGGKPDQRLPWLKRAVAARPGYAVALFELGRAELEAGRATAAYRAYLAAWRADPTDTQARQMVGRLALRQCDWALAAEIWGAAEGPEAALARYRIAAETGADTAQDLLGDLLTDPATRAEAFKLMVRTARGSVPLHLPG